MAKVTKKSDVLSVDTLTISGKKYRVAKITAAQKTGKEWQFDGQNEFNTYRGERVAILKPV